MIFFFILTRLYIFHVPRVNLTPLVEPELVSAMKFSPSSRFRERILDQDIDHCDYAQLPEVWIATLPANKKIESMSIEISVVTFKLLKNRRLLLCAVCRNYHFIRHCLTSRLYVVAFTLRVYCRLLTPLPSVTQILCPNAISLTFKSVKSAWREIVLPQWKR